MNWLTAAFEALQAIPTNAALRERRELAEQQKKLIEEKFGVLDAENMALREKVAALEADNARLRAAEDARKAVDAAVRPKVIYGCYQFEGDRNLYCPGCYDARGKKFLATRIRGGSYRCSVSQATHGR